MSTAIENHFPLVLLLPTEPLAKPLHSLPAFNKLISSIIAESYNHEASRKYKKPLFSHQELENYKERLKSLMEQDELFLDAQLSLRSLAEYMNLPANHMSQLLNEGFQQNFSNYVNTYRLENFKVKLQDAHFSHLTLLALAYDSGFSSKTVFNTFFKSKLGMTPKAYWNQLKQ